MWPTVAIFVHLWALAESDGCKVGTTSVQLIKDKGYDLTGQTHVITGGDSGLGLGIATAMMEANARVVFLAHDVNKTHSVVRDIENRTGNSNFRIIPADLLSLNSTRNAANALMDEEQINVFIGDAGSIMMTSFVTPDGFESEFQLEYLSHFYLVQRLLPKLRESHGRIVFTGSDGTSPYDKTAGLCSQLNFAPQGCEALDRIAARINRTVPSQIFAHFSGNEFLGLYLRVMLARQVALFETNVTAFSFHPGWADTPGTSGAFDKKAEQWFAMFGLGAAGLVLGSLAGLVRHSFVAPLLGIVLGGLSGYLFAGGWVVTQYCGMVPYYQCLCNDPDGTTTANSCPLGYLEGSMGGAYLAAENASELVDVNGAMTVLCGDHPTDLAFDPYVGMVDAVGEPATRDYLWALSLMSQQWIDEAGYGSSQSKFVETVSDRVGIGSDAQIIA